MAALIHNAFPVNPDYVEGIVGPVDLENACCQVKTLRGQIINGVLFSVKNGGRGRSGDHDTPSPNDRVIVFTGLGYPVIAFYLPSPTDREVFPVPIDSYEKALDTGNYSAVNGGPGANMERPPDMYPGDKLKTSHGGGLLGVLRGGSIIAKASRLAQIFISKYDDLVRIVGRNHEVFTDACLNVYASIRGVIYRYVGYSTNLKDSRSDTFQYEEFYGHTAAAEALKGNYIDAKASDIPTANDILRKYKVGTAMSETLETSGTLTRTIGHTVLTHQDASWVVENGTSTVTIDANQVHAVHGSAELLINDNEALVKLGGHQVLIDSAGVHLS